MKKKGNTVYQDQAEKEAERKRKAQARLEKHIVTCPHCGEKALDHMTQCPHCKGELTPSGYVAPDSKKYKIIRYTCWGVFIAIAIVIAVLIIVL